MSQVNYLDGLDDSSATLHPDRLAPEDKIRSVRKELQLVASSLRLFRFPPGQRQRLGPTDAADQIEGSIICESFARLRPDIAAEAGEPAAHFAALITTRLALEDAHAEAGDVSQAALITECSVQQAMTLDVIQIFDQVRTRLDDPTLPEADKDLLRARFKNIDQTSQKLAQRTADFRGRLRQMSASAAKRTAEKEQQARRLLRKADLQRRLNDGDLPALGLDEPAPPTRRSRGNNGGTP